MFMHRLRARSKKPFRYERKIVSLVVKWRFTYCKPMLCIYANIHANTQPPTLDLKKAFVQSGYHEVGVSVTGT